MSETEMSEPCSAPRMLTHFPCPCKLMVFPRKVVWRLLKREEGNQGEAGRPGPDGTCASHHAGTRQCHCHNMLERSRHHLHSHRGSQRERTEAESPHLLEGRNTWPEPPTATCGSGCAMEAERPAHTSVKQKSLFKSHLLLFLNKRFTREWNLASSLGSSKETQTSASPSSRGGYDPA